MDTPIFIRSFSALLLGFTAPTYADIFDMSEHSGFIRDSNGNYSRVSANGSVRSLTSNTALSVAEKVNFQTSKGVFSADIIRTALIDTARIGKTVRGIAVASGPIGMTLTAVSLVCELTAICNEAGQWMIGTETNAWEPSSYPATNGQWSAWNNRFVATPEAGCRDAERITMNVGPSPSQYIFDHMEQLSTDTYKCFARSIQYGTVFYASNTSSIAGCAPGYTVQGSSCVKDGTTTRAVTPSDWDSKESILNDSRFIPELNAKDQPIPVQTPSLPNPVNVPIGKETKTTKDGSGNVTGTEETTTTAKLEQPASNENPSNNPNLLKISETSINNTYNINNQLISSTTTTTGAGTDQQPQSESIKIDIDDMQDAQLETYQAPMNFAYDSWGSGSCPADRSVNYHYGSLNLTFQPACDFAVGIQPVVLVVAGMIAMYILAGVKLND